MAGKPADGGLAPIAFPVEHFGQVGLRDADAAGKRTDGHATFLQE